MYISLTRHERYLLYKMQRYNHSFTFDMIERHTGMSPKLFRPMLKKFRQLGLIILTHYWDEDQGTVCGSGHYFTELAEKYVSDLRHQGYSPDDIGHVREDIMADLSQPLPTFSEKR